ncbi:phospholipase A1 VesT1.02-like [Bacillus rossius redtenbacheri]|uniref:phospholipase A1 VesT1.02-like n=1 Tax=Bacillus rossius redtenbacheri TaxID=93214 RepID=UPI002FDEFC18
MHIAWDDTSGAWRHVFGRQGGRVGAGKGKSGDLGGSPNQPAGSRRTSSMAVQGSSSPSPPSPMWLPLLLAAAFSLPAGSRGQGALTQALFMGNVDSNATLADCVWRRGNDNDVCPDPDVFYYLYTSEQPSARKTMNTREADWLRTAGWNPQHDNVILIHGYNGGDDSHHVQVMRNAYLRNGSYNVFVVDWHRLASPPCYPPAVHNMRPVARCAAAALAFLRDSGLQPERTTCVGHSLGAHVCGLVARHLRFRLHRIIGLDPARPLVRGSSKLGRGDASVVQVIHTNAGTYGETGRVGLVDFCVNGGREQPHCAGKSNAALCSHARSICYLAESVNSATARRAEPCRSRCPNGPRLPGGRPGVTVVLGQHTPDRSSLFGFSASGMYCVTDEEAPYCPSSPGAPGDPMCCN